MHGIRHGGCVHGIPHVALLVLLQPARRRRAAVAAAAAGPHTAVIRGMLGARVAIRGRTSPALELPVAVIIPRFSGARRRRSVDVTAAASWRSGTATWRWRIAVSLMSVTAGWRCGAPGVRIAVRRRRCAPLVVTLCGGAARGARAAPVRGRVGVGTAAAAASIATIAPESVFALAVTHSVANLRYASLLFKMAALRRARGAAAGDGWEGARREQLDGD